MKHRRPLSMAIGLLLGCWFSFACGAELSEPRSFEPFVWPSTPPADCPFAKSEDVHGVMFTGVHSDYRVADTWYPTWASDGNLYSPWSDGTVPRRDGARDYSNSSGHQDDGTRMSATTGQAVMIGDDPANLEIHSLGIVRRDPYPYGGRYPCGSLIHNGVWYYGTYCLSPIGTIYYGGREYNWPWLGPFVGFRVSRDCGRTWTTTDHTPEKPLFGETGRWGYPVKIGAPHFVDFGQNMEHSPDGKAYLVAHGAVERDPQPRFANLSWITGDQIYLVRVLPRMENINDASQYEYFSGHDDTGQPVWTRDFAKIEPLVDWNNRCGCVTATYNAPLKKYLMWVTDGWVTTREMHTYVLESDHITGPWKMVTFMSKFGAGAYFVNLPAKFISRDGRTAWLCYSANFGWMREHGEINPPGSRYGLVMQQLRLLSASSAEKIADQGAKAFGESLP